MYRRQRIVRLVVVNEETQETTLGRSSDGIPNDISVEPEHREDGTVCSSLYELGNPVLTVVNEDAQKSTLEVSSDGIANDISIDPENREDGTVYSSLYELGEPELTVVNEEAQETILEGSSDGIANDISIDPENREGGTVYSSMYELGDPVLTVVNEEVQETVVERSNSGTPNDILIDPEDREERNVCSSLEPGDPTTSEQDSTEPNAEGNLALTVEQNNETSSSEDNLFTGASSSGSEYAPSSASSDTNVPRAQKRRSKGQAAPKYWKRAKNAEARLKGETYVGFKKDCTGKYQQNAEKPNKILKARCDGHIRHTVKGPKQDFQCSTITDDERMSIFKIFWNLKTWEERKIYVNGLVTARLPKYKNKNKSRPVKPKNISYTYHLKLKREDYIIFPVCKKMFLATLGMGEMAVRLWLQKGIGCSRDADESHEETNQEPYHEPRQQTQQEARQEHSGPSANAKKFLEALPKMESHYCRASTRKLYLEPVWESYRAIYKEFVTHCENENKRHCSWRTFYKIFKGLNLELYVPRKDQCNKCVMFKRGNLDATTYEEHNTRKTLAREEKAVDKGLAKSDQTDVCVYTVDLQAVLLSPRLQASAMYYKTKLKVHNYTIFNLNDKDVYSFVWHEANGGLESDVFTTILVKFLETEIEKLQPSRIIIWSDGCGYQNRNTKLANGLLELAMEKKVTIIQKYLEPGHTQMEVDSVHSVVERKLKRQKEIFVPADYLHVIKSARCVPQPYKVVSLTYKYFEKYSETIYSSIRPGNKAGEPCVTDVCAYKYDPQGIINYKTKFTDLWTTLPRRPKKTNQPRQHSPLYTSPCEIELSKFQHLQELKQLIPADHHHFYNSLKHKNCSDERCPHIV